MQVDGSPKVQNAHQNGSPDYLSVRKTTTNRFSHAGISLASTVAAVAMIATLFIASAVSTKPDYMQAVIYTSGAMLAILGTGSASQLGARPGPELPALKTLVVKPWKSLGSFFRKYRDHSQAITLLVFVFLLSDALMGLAGVTLRLGRQDLCLDDGTMIFLIAVLNAASALGAGASFLIQQKASLSDKAMLVGHTFVMATMCLLGMLGLVSEAHTAFTRDIEMTMLCLFIGLNYGSIKSYCRTLFSAFTPRGREGLYFTLFSVASSVDFATRSLLYLTVHSINMHAYYLVLSLLFLILGAAAMAFIKPSLGIEQGRGMI